jgi:hypothetical protein
LAIEAVNAERFYQPAIEVSPKATADKAACRDGGSDFPRFSARRRIPAQAVPLKKNLCGIESVSSTCDNEHTAASLGHSEILGIQDAPSCTSLGSINATRIRPAVGRIKWLITPDERGEEASEGVVGCAEDSWDVFPEYDGGGQSANKSSVIDCICYLAKSKGKIAPSIAQGLAQASD